MDWLGNITEDAKKEIVGIVGAEYPEAGKRVDEILECVVERFGGTISRNGLEDYIRLYVEFLDFGDLLRLRDELGKQWMADTVSDICVVLGILIRRAYGKYMAHREGKE